MNKIVDLALWKRTFKEPKDILYVIRKISEYKRQHPDAYFFSPKWEPKNLCYTIEAFSEKEDEVREFRVRFGSLRKDKLTQEQYRVIQNLEKARTAMFEAEKEFIEMLSSIPEDNPVPS